MMLERRQNGRSDQHAPDVPRRRRNAAQPLPQMTPDDDGERDMQRRRLIERLVEAAKHIEHEARQAARLRPRETGGEREGEEATHGDGLRGEIARGQAVDARFAGVEEQRQRVEGVDRPVGNDRPGEERHRPFPIVDNAADMVALRSRPIGEAVGQVEHRRQEGEPQRGALGDDGEGCGCHAALAALAVWRGSAGPEDPPGKKARTTRITSSRRRTP